MHQLLCLPNNLKSDRWQALSPSFPFSSPSIAIRFIDDLPTLDILTLDFASTALQPLDDWVGCRYQIAIVVRLIDDLRDHRRDGLQLAGYGIYTRLRSDRGHETLYILDQQGGLIFEVDLYG